MGKIKNKKKNSDYWIEFFPFEKFSSTENNEKKSERI